MKPVIIMVTSRFPPVYSGAGKQAMTLAQALNRNGRNVKIITLDQHNQGKNKQKNLEVARLPLILKKYPKISKRFGHLSLGIFSGVIVLTQPKLIAVHIHGNYWWSAFPAISGYLRRKPVIVKMTRLGDDDYETSRNKRVFGIPFGWFYTLSFKVATRIIAPSQALYETVPNGITSVVKVPNGVNQSEYYPKAKTPTDELSRVKLSILSVGYLAPMKGFDLVIKAATIISNEIDCEIEVNLVGQFSSEYSEVVPDYLKEFTSSQKVQINLIGEVEPHLMPGVYRENDIFVLASTHEGMPNSALEAISCGLVTVLSAIPGNLDIDPDKKTILYFASKDLNELCMCLLKAIENSKYYGARSRNLAIESFDINVVVKRYLEFYGLTDGE